MVFVLFWISTSLLLSKYVTRIGKFRYVSLTLLPLLYFIIPFTPGLLDWLIEYRSLSPTTFAITYTLFFSNSIPIAALFFGLAFWSIGKTIENPYIKNYMYMAGYGIALFFICNQSILLISAPFPPTYCLFYVYWGFHHILYLSEYFRHPYL